jgi:hypothetical protein
LFYHKIQLSQGRVPFLLVLTETESGIIVTLGNKKPLKMGHAVQQTLVVRVRVHPQDTITLHALEAVFVVDVIVHGYFFQWVNSGVTTLASFGHVGQLHESVYFHPRRPVRFRTALSHRFETGAQRFSRFDLRLFFAELFDDVDCAAVLFLLDLVGLPALEFGTQLLGPRRFLRLNTTKKIIKRNRRNDEITQPRSSHHRRP